jgi:hypothetical protein
MSDYPQRVQRVLMSGVMDIEYAVRTNGSMEAKEWFEAQNDEIKAKFDHLFRKVANGQKIHNEQHFRKLRKHIWEFKRDEHRLLTFQHGKGWFLTHHYPKGKRKCPPKQIDRAEQIRLECLEILQKEAEDDNADS